MDKHSIILPRREEKRIIAEFLSSGFHHHSYLQEKLTLNAILCQGKEQDQLIKECVYLYTDLLGDSTIRSSKNGIICLLTVISRSAIEYGVDAEYSFATSDYFINLVEKARNTEEILLIFREILEFYAELVAESSIKGYSSDVSRAIRYVNAHLYEPIKVKDVAEYIRMDPQSFSRLFSSETGTAPSDYIERKKIEEAKLLLIQEEMSISQIAETLGFCSGQHFSLRFKKATKMTPKHYRNENAYI